MDMIEKAWQKAMHPGFEECCEPEWGEDEMETLCHAKDCPAVAWWKAQGNATCNT